MPASSLGNELKRLAEASGSLVGVDVPNTYLVMEALSRFFYGKKHEWVAICFLDGEFICRMIWFNKGPSRKAVPVGLLPSQAVAVAQRAGTSHIIIAHNHPASSRDMPDYGLRSLNIQASYMHKRSLLGFSEADIETAAHWQGVLHKAAISHAEAIFVAGTYQLQGDQAVLDNYEQHRPRPKACYIASAVFGPDAYETRLLRAYRDTVLARHWAGRAFCYGYYAVSPVLARYLARHPRIGEYTRRALQCAVRCASRMDEVVTTAEGSSCRTGCC